MKTKSILFLFTLILLTQSCKVKELPANSFLGTWYVVHVEKTYNNVDLNINCDIEKGKVKWIFTEDTIEIINNNEDDSCPSPANATVPWELVTENNKHFLGGANYMSGRLTSDGNQFTLDFGFQVSGNLNNVNFIRFER